IPVGVLAQQAERIKNILSKAGGGKAIADILDVNLSTAQVQNGVREIRKALAAVGPGENIQLGLSDAGVLSQIARVRQAIGALGSGDNAIVPSAIIGPGQNWTATVTGFESTARAASDAATVLEEWLAANDRATVSLVGLDDELRQKPGDVDKVSGAFGRGIPLWAGAGRWFGLLTRQIPLFGGALSGVLPIILSHVSAWHLLADGIVETAAVVIPAGVALAAFGAAAASTVNDIVNKETALFTITTATGRAFPGLTSGLQHFTDSVKPQVYVLLGAALNTINAHTGLFQTLATGAGRVLDNLAVRAQLALGGSGLNGLIAKGAEDLQLLGNIFGNVFGIIGNLLKTVPGYAQPIFQAIGDITGAIEAFTANSVVQKIINVGLAFHGVWLYAGVLVTGSLALVGAIARLGAAFLAFGSVQVLSGVNAIKGFGTAIAGAVTGIIGYASAIAGLAAEEGIVAAATLVMSDAFAAIPVFGWALIGVTALTALALWLGNTKSAAQQSLDAIEKLAEGATSFAGVSTQLSAGIAKTNAQLASTPKYIAVGTDAIHGQAQGITEKLNPAYTDLQRNLVTLNGQYTLQGSRLAELDKITGSAANTVADFQALGVKGFDISTNTIQLTNGQTESYAQLETQLKDLMTAETQLAGFTAGPAAAAQNALTNLFLNEQLPAIQKITT
ncbi:MAG TPA: hypothetical protein VNH17_01640, partial [Streptosporangiaceae bacterium]|nr:hypothetical protein [Streptosporangiaceae bacterium]